MLSNEDLITLNDMIANLETRVSDELCVDCSFFAAGECGDSCYGGCTEGYE